MNKLLTGASIFLLGAPLLVKAQQRKRARDYGIDIGVIPPGKFNSITDVPGVTVGHRTLIQGDSIRTGVTAVIPHPGNVFQQKIPAGIYVGNGHGKMSGGIQIEELGNLETPIILTNTLNISTGMDALIEYTLKYPGNEKVRSVNALVGECSDGRLNDIPGQHVKKQDVLLALKDAKTGSIEEGCVGAGTGTTCFGWKGGIGTASRQLPESLGGYLVGVLVQSNYGGVLQINGVPVGKELGTYSFSEKLSSKSSADGSCMMVLATNAPLDSRNLKRLASRAFMGLAKTGGIAANGSGDIAIAFSTAKENFVPYLPEERTQKVTVVHNDHMSPLFMAAIEATEEAIINSMFAAVDVTGVDGVKVEALPMDRVLDILKKYNCIKYKQN